MFKRYLTVFDNVLVVARCTAIKEDAVDENTRVDNNGACQDCCHLIVSKPLVT